MQSIISEFEEGEQLMNDEILKSILEALQGINSGIREQNEQLERLNDNLDSITGTFKDNTFLNVVARVMKHEKATTKVRTFDNGQ